VKLNKQQLISACEKAIERQKEAQVEWDRDIAKAKIEWERKWRENILPMWIPFLQKVKQAGETGSPVTEDDLPRIKVGDGYSSRVALYHPFSEGKMERWGTGSRFMDSTHDLGPRPVYEVRNLENLLDFLRTVEDETVTTAALERVGFRNLAKLTDAVRNGHWES